jgi:hypothetical protein
MKQFYIEHNESSADNLGGFWSMAFTTPINDRDKQR